MVLKAVKTARHGIYKHAAVVIRGGSIISIGVNHDQVHAEVAALKKLWPSERRGTKIVTLRLRKSGGLGIAKPCPACEQYMRDNGVKAVTYSDVDGNMQRMRL
jgi:pyrimidine deaminase RibD-like protein